MQTLLLSERDLAQLLDERIAIEAMEEVFRLLGEGKVQMPPKIYLDLKDYEGDLRAMPSYIPALHACGLKWVNSHPRNNEGGVFPAVMGVFILNDPKTGFPLAILDGTSITRLRTGAVGALASKYLANPKSSVLALVGCGIQAETQLHCHREIFQFDRIQICAKTDQETEDFIKRMSELGISGIMAFKTVMECVKDADIICTTTPSHQPILMSQWIKPGVHINAIGADGPGKQELDPQILKNSFLVVDDIHQAIHGGEINVPMKSGLMSLSDIDTTLGELIAAKKSYHHCESVWTVFDSTGLAIQDLALAQKAFLKANTLNLGQKWTFFSS